jgi:coproporphyrinogen III oxidase
MEKREKIADWFQDLQSDIISQLEKEDGKGKFGSEKWERPGGGGGLTRLLVGGNVIEKGGVNFSAVFGETPKPIQQSFKTEAKDFFATGVSIVIHPENPWVPIIHMNVRYFELSNGQNWFGGGIDLTPAFVFEEDGRFFHQSLKNACESYDSQCYNTFKETADNYFFIPHRNETRGIGGIFYDRMEAVDDKQFDKLWLLTQSVGSAFAPIYTQLMSKRKNLIWGEKEKEWQLHRRSRYVEFNLVYDAGTKFGLETNGRTESILMSMPPLARWESNYFPKEETEEWKSQQFFRKGITWI